MRRSISTLFATLIVIASSLPAAAQNLLSNAELDADIAGWPNDTNDGQFWSADDADGCQGSGSLSGAGLKTSDSSEFRYFGTRAPGCVAVTEGEVLYAGVRYRTDADFARLVLTYCSDAACNSCGASSPFLAVGDPSADWAAMEGSIAIPAGVGSVRLRVDAAKGNGAFSVSFDRAYLGRVDRIFADDFEIGGTCRW